MCKAGSKKVSKGRTALALIAAGLLFCAGITWMVRAHNQPVASSSSLAGESARDIGPGSNASTRLLGPDQKPTRVETELVTIQPQGFEPKQITRPVGRFNLLVDNRSGLEDVSLQIDVETGPRLRSVHVNRSQLDWNDVFDLPPGNYTLTEANHSDWVCRITINTR